VFNIPCDTPTVTWFDLMGLITDRQLDLSADKVSGLFMRMAMFGEIGPLFKSEFCHQGLIAIGQRFLLDFFEDIFVIVFATLSVRAGSLYFYVTS
jgi:hypothetical protein